jgi:ribonucleoside-diphosphate reductase alpha subunit
MFVKKRNGNMEEVSFDKILNRIKTLGNLNNQILTSINYTELAIKVIDQLYDGIDTSKIDELTAEQCASLTTQHPDFGELAIRILISNHHKNTNSSFSKVMSDMYHFKDVHGVDCPMISQEMYKTIVEHSELIDSRICHERDYTFDYFGFKTLEKAYLMKINGKIVERPQYMWMRVSLGIHGNDLEKAFETYDLMSQKYFTHATPTLFNAGTPRPQMSSCYLIGMESDSIEGMYNTIKECALISKWSGGIGLHIHNIRANGSHIRGTNGESSGIVPLLRVLNNTARHVNQGGKRNGSFAMYLEPWHADIEDFLEMRKNHGDEEMKARDLFYALWMPDLFMKRIQENGNWTLMCPDKCPGLSDVYGEQFEELYTHYENEHQGNKTIPARKLWFQILDSQIETGTPYLLYKDAANRKSNQKNVGTIKSSNLCTEIMEYSDDKETAVCNLASIGLSKFVEPYQQDTNDAFKVYGRSGCIYCNLSKYLLDTNNVTYEYIELNDDEERKEFYATISKNEELETPIHSVPQIFMNNKRIGGYEELTQIVRPTFNYDKLHQVTKVITNNLNKVIDLNFYPTSKTRLSNMKHRPIGLGIQGLADVFCMMNTSFESDLAREINKNIFETIYHAALEASMEEAKERKQAMIQLKECYNNVQFSFGRNIENYELEESSKTYIQYGDESDHDDNESDGSTLDYKSVKELLQKYKPCMEEFRKLSSQYKGAYSSFEGSPASQGYLQFDLWNTEPSNRYDWDLLKSEIKQHGLRNSLLVAPMPTASTSQILGNNECFEPFTSNIYLRRTIAGEFVVINKYLLKELTSIGLWNNDIKNNIIYNKGSVQEVPNLPKCIKEKYKIVWEMPMKRIIEYAADRGPYICQSQSMNLWMENPQYDKLTAMHFFAWKKGLKTGIYYLRTKAKAAAQQFTIEPPKNMKMNLNTSKNASQNDDEGCLMCSG